MIFRNHGASLSLSDLFSFGLICHCILVLCVSGSCFPTSVDAAGTTIAKLGCLVATENLGGVQKMSSFLLAVNEINANASILPNVTLEAVPMFTNQSDAMGLRLAVNSMISPGNNVAALFGPGSSDVTDSIQYVASVEDIPQIGFAASGQFLSDRDYYPSFLRVIGSDRYLVQAGVMFVRLFNWNELGIVYPTSQYGDSISESFEEELKMHADIDWIVHYSFDVLQMNFSSILRKISVSHLEVVVLLMEDFQARLFFKEVVKVGFNGTFLVGDGVASHTVYQMKCSGDCVQSPVDEEVIEGMQYLLGLRPSLGTDERRDFWETKWRSLNASEYPGTGPNVTSIDPYVPFVYDAVYLYALVLNDLLNEGAALPTGNPYDIPFDTMYSRLSNYSFIGVTGNVTLKEGERVSDVFFEVVNFVNETFRPITEWSPDYVPGPPSNRTIYWGTPGNQAPLGTLHLANLGGLFPMSLYVGETAKRALEMAIEDINALKDLLPRTLIGNEGTIVDTGETREHLLESLLEFQGRSVIGFVGAYSSTSSISTTLIGSIYQYPQISYGSTLEDLSDDNLYPYFMRVVPSDKWQTRALCDIMEYYKFDSIALLSSPDDYSSGGAQVLEKAISTRDYLVHIHTGLHNKISDENEDYVRQMFTSYRDSGVRIFVAFVRVELMPFVFRVASDLGMTGAGYAWLAGDSGALDSAFTFANGTVMNDTKRDMLGILSTRPACGNSSMFAEKWRSKGYGENYDYFSPFVYDAAFAFAHALHNLTENNAPLRRETVLKVLHNVSFPGVTGWVSFDEDGDRCPVYDIVNLRDVGGGDVEYEVVAQWTRRTGDACVDSREGLPNPLKVVTLTDGTISFFKPNVVWPGGTTDVPDPSLMCPLHFYPNYIFVPMTVMNCITFLFAFIPFAFLILRVCFKTPIIVFGEIRRSTTFLVNRGKKKKTKSVISSRRVRHFFSNTPFLLIILFGCMMLNVSVLFRSYTGELSGFYETALFCHLQMWAYAIGTIFLIAPLLAKVLALRSAIKRARKKVKSGREPYRFDDKKILSNARLANQVIINLIVVFVLCGIVSLVDAVSDLDMAVYEKTTNDQCRYRCLTMRNLTSSALAVGYMFVILFPVLLTWGATIMALRVQLMKGKKPTESKWIINAVLNICFIIGFLIPVLFLSLDKTQFYTLECCCISFVTTLTILLLLPSKWTEIVSNARKKRQRERELRAVMDAGLLDGMGMDGMGMGTDENDVDDDSKYELPPPTSAEDITTRLREQSLKQPLLDDDAIIDDDDDDGGNNGNVNEMQGVLDLPYYGNEVEVDDDVDIEDEYENETDEMDDYHEMGSSDLRIDGYRDDGKGNDGENDTNGGGGDDWELPSYLRGDDDDENVDPEPLVLEEESSSGMLRFSQVYDIDRKKK